MEKHQYIKWVENTENKFFSEIELPPMSIDLNNFEKFEKVYSQSNTVNWKSQIFKNELFYLYLIKINDTSYTGMIYYEIRNADKIKFYIQSLLKKIENGKTNVTTT
jgi:hypothetical protein